MAGGDLVAAVRARTGAALVPVDSEHSALFQLLEGAGPERVAAGDPDGLGGSVPRATPPTNWRGSRAADALRASHLDDGGEDHDRLGDDDEQGPRGDRGAPPVRPAATSRIEVIVHPQSFVHAMVRLRRRQRADATAARRTCACRSAMRCATRAAAAGARRWTSSGGGSTSRRPTRPRSRCLALARAAGRRGRHRAGDPERAPTRWRWQAFLDERIGLHGHPAAWSPARWTPSPAVAGRHPRRGRCRPTRRARSRADAARRGAGVIGGQRPLCSP